MRSRRVLGIIDEESKDTLATREEIQEKNHLQDRRKAFIDVRANDPGLFRHVMR